MSKWLVCVGLAAYVAVCGADDIGEGLWQVISIERCDNYSSYDIDYDIVKSRVSRTEEAFSGFVNVPEDIDESMGIRAEILKCVDGGCKPYHYLEDSSFCAFIKKFAKTNFEDVLGKMGLDVTDCPLPQGNHTLAEYVIDYSELPPRAVYGLFRVFAVLTRQRADVGCCAVVARFYEDDGDE